MWGACEGVTPSRVLRPALCRRCHVIAQFNRGIYDYIVAMDEESPVPQPEPEPEQLRPRKRRGPARG